MPLSRPSQNCELGKHRLSVCPVSKQPTRWGSDPPLGLCRRRLSECRRLLEALRSALFPGQKTSR